MTAEQLAVSLGRHTRKSGGGFMACCPAHDDRTPSLSIDDGDEGRLLVRCMAGCDQGDVIEALKSRGLWEGNTTPLPMPRKTTSSQIWMPIFPVPTDTPPPPGRHYRHGNPSMTWEYRNAQGDLLGLAYRFDKPEGGKEVLPLTFCACSNRREWRWQAFPEPRPLYGAELVGDHQHVVMVEGEKAADAARRMLGDRLPVVTWPGGSNAVSKADWSLMKGRSIAVWPDNDSPGFKAALAVADCCLAAGAIAVKIVIPPAEAPEGWDLADAEAEGWEGTRVREFLKSAVTPEEFRTQNESTPLDEVVSPEATGELQDTSGSAEKTKNEPPPPLRYRLRPGSALRSLNITITWIMAGLIPEQSVILFFGRGGLGKSTLAIQIAGAIAAEREIFGRQTTRRPVLYVDFENSLAVLSERLRHICADDVLFLDSSANPPRLDKAERVQYLDLLLEYPGAVFVFDTLRSSQGGDENDSQAMTEVMAFLRLLRDRGATVIVLHHTPKASERKYKGSGAIFDMCDHVLALYPVKASGDDSEVEDDDDDEARVFRFGTAMKTRYEPTRLFLTFDPESKCFVQAPDPGQEQLRLVADSIRAIISRGDLATQSRIIDALAGTIPKGKVPGLLNRGSGTLWTSEKGMHNASLYTPIASSSDPQPYKGRGSEELSSSSPSPPGKEIGKPDGNGMQVSVISEFPSSPQFPEAAGELAEEQSVLNLTADDFEGVF